MSYVSNRKNVVQIGTGKHATRYRKRFKQKQEIKPVDTGVCEYCGIRGARQINTAVDEMWLCDQCATYDSDDVEGEYE